MPQWQGYSWFMVRIFNVVPSNVTVTPTVESKNARTSMEVSSHLDLALVGLLIASTRALQYHVVVVSSPRTSPTA
jgi:hypothetical protein